MNCLNDFNIALNIFNVEHVSLERFHPIYCHNEGRTLHLKQNIFEPVHEKTNNLGFRPGPTQTRLYSHRSRLEA